MQRAEGYPAENAVATTEGGGAPLAHVVALGIILALAVQGCAKAKYDPWIAPEALFFGSVRTIALAPVVTPQDLDDSEPVAAMFDSLLSAMLQAAGFRVVGRSVVAKVWKRGIDSAGGYFDPRTGHEDTTRRNALRRYLSSRLRVEHEADAILFPSIMVVSAEFSEWKAKWDGASQGIESVGGTLLRGLFGFWRRGTTTALSLSVQIESVDGDVLFINRGGIEVWGRPGGGLKGGLRRVPRNELFDEPERNAKAVQIALRPIVERSAVPDVR